MKNLVNLIWSFRRDVFQKSQKLLMRLAFPGKIHLICYFWLIKYQVFQAVITKKKSKITLRPSLYIAPEKFLSIDG